MRQMPLECDINIAITGCSGFATFTQKAPFTAMLMSRSRGTYLIELASFPGGNIREILDIVSKPFISQTTRY